MANFGPRWWHLSMYIGSNYNVLATSAYQHWPWVRISIRARCTTLCDKVCQWLATGVSDYQTFGLSDGRTIEHSDYWTFGQSPFIQSYVNSNHTRSGVSRVWQVGVFIFNKISLLSHLFFLNLTCSCPYSYNLMLMAIDMTIVSIPLYSVANKSITCRQGPKKIF
jgi:hypothetical protein